MRQPALILALLAVCVMTMGTALAPTEGLKDPAQDERARGLYREVRCIVCQNESVADSQADMAKDVRRLIRQDISQGQSDAQIRQNLRARFGDYVLFRPQWRLSTTLLWFGPFLIVLLGGLALWHLTKTRKISAPYEDDTALSPEEEKKIKRLLSKSE